RWLPPPAELVFQRRAPGRSVAADCSTRKSTMSPLCDLIVRSGTGIAVAFRGGTRFGRGLFFGELSFQCLDSPVLVLERFDQDGHADGQDDTDQPEGSWPIGLIDRDAAHEQDTTQGQNQNRHQQQPSTPFHTHPPSCAASRRTPRSAAAARGLHCWTVNNRSSC